jgi:hypothetical protein
VIVVTETPCFCSELLSTVSLFTSYSWKVNPNASIFAHIYRAISSLKFKIESVEEIIWTKENRGERTGSEENCIVRN